MKKILLISVILLLVAGGNVYATPFLVGENKSGYEVADYHQVGDVWNETYGGYSAGSLDSFTGYYLGTFSGNTDGKDDPMLKLISYYLGEPIGDALLKYDVGTSPTTGMLSISMNTGKTAGDWTLKSTDPMNNAVNFYAVKASSSFALYFLEPVASKGIWTTAHFKPGENFKELSHLSAATTAAPVPEPATMFLLGVGLVGLAGFRRKSVK